MEGILRVSPETLKSTASEFNSTNAQIKTITEEMVTTITNLKNQWEGSASDAYIAKVTGLQSDMEKIYNLINEHATDLSEMAEEYIRAENENASISEGLSPSIF